MSFAVFTDSCSNLPGSLLQHFGIRVLPCSYTVDGKQIIYGGDIEAFDAHTYYELLRQGKRVTTSLLNTQVFLDHFRPALEQGLDVVYVGLSAGISGTYQAACIAAAELRDEFPERTVCPVDSMGAGFGTGLLVPQLSGIANLICNDAAVGMLNGVFVDHIGIIHGCRLKQELSSVFLSGGPIQLYLVWKRSSERYENMRKFIEFARKRSRQQKWPIG